MSRLYIAGNAVDQNSVPIVGAQVYVRANGTLATLQDAAGALKPNPLTTIDAGFFEAYSTTAGTHTLEYYWGGRLRLVETLSDTARAEAAAQAALAAAGAPSFPNTAAGLAGVGFGETFYVVNAGVGTTYRKDAGPTATQIGKFLVDPTASGAASLIGKAGGGTVQDELTALIGSGGSGRIGFLQSGTGAVARTVRTKLQEVSVSITDYGAASGGSRAANEAAFAAAIAEVQARGGGIVDVPVGQFDANTISVPDGAAVRIRGVGEQSVIRTTSATADLITLTAWYSGVERIKIISSVTRTDGDYVKLVGAYTRAQDCHFVGDFVGVRMSGVGAKIVSNVFSNGANGARRIWATGGDTSQTIENNLMAAQGAGVSAGIFVDNSAALKIVNNDIIGQGRCLHIAPGNGQSVFSLWSRGNFYDTATYGIAIEPSGTGTVFRTTIEDDWGSDHTQTGILISATGSAVVNGVDIDGVEMNLNDVDGISLTGSGVSNVRIYGTPIVRGNVGAGVSLGAGVSNVTVDGVQCQAADGLSANAIGLFINGGAVSFTVTNCNFSGQTSANVAGFSPGVAGKIVRDCIGFVTETRGSAVIPNGSSSVTVTHGLAETPTRIVTTPRQDPAGRWWCENANRTSTQFTINQNNGAVGYNVTYDWVAHYE